MCLYPNVAITCTLNVLIMAEGAHKSENVAPCVESPKPRADGLLAHVGRMPLLVETPKGISASWE